MKILKLLLQKLFFRATPKPKEEKWDGLPSGELKRGRYEYNKETGQMEHMGDLKNDKAMYPMWLQEYLNRKGNTGKGSWQRPTDPRYAIKRDDDFGKVGCKKGFHSFDKDVCIHCNRKKSQIEKEEKE